MTKITQFYRPQSSKALWFECLQAMKCSLVRDARKVFDGMPERSMVSWNTMIGSLAKSGDEREALGLFSRMHRESRRFSEFTVSSVLCACAGKASVSE